MTATEAVLEKRRRRPYGQRTEFRVVWKRQGLPIKRKKYPARSRAEKFMTIFGSCPWLAFDQDPDAFECCSGHGCSCGGRTIRQAFAERYAEIPKLEWVRLEYRMVGPWQPAEYQ